MRQENHKHVDATIRVRIYDTDTIGRVDLKKPWLMLDVVDEQGAKTCSGYNVELLGLGWDPGAEAQADGEDKSEVRACWVCGSAEGELFPSNNDNPPFHQPCVERFRAEKIACLNTMIEIAESGNTPFPVRVWRKVLNWIRPVEHPPKADL